jgi:DNA-binding NtrC family response regulator
VRVVVLAASDERARTLRVALLERGFLVDIVDNAPDALVAARSADVLVVDLELATFDGHAFAVGAREVLPALRVVVVGGPEVTPPGFRCVPASATGESVAAAVRAVLFQDASEGPSH